MILVTSGCGFSECISTHLETWPTHLARNLDIEHHSVAMRSQGNGLISRRLIYKVSELLKTHDSSELLVGIMWSGPGRHDFHTWNEVNFKHNIDGWVDNPTYVVPGHNKWVILNHGWVNEYAKTYYSTFYDYIGAIIYTYEHVLRTQWFLKQHNIKYFMAPYTSQVFNLTQDIEVKHLYDMIDFDQFLPVTGEYEWCRDYSGLEFPRLCDHHPSTEQHKLFTEQVIMPFLEQKGCI